MSIVRVVYGKKLWPMDCRHFLYSALTLAALLSNGCQSRDRAVADSQANTSAQGSEISNEVVQIDEPTNDSVFPHDTTAVLATFDSYESDSQAVLQNFSCLDDSAFHFQAKRFSLEGTCRRQDADECAYFDYRSADLTGTSGFDQRGTNSYQVTFPGQEHLWAALSIKNPSGSRFCWVGGAHIGRNPLAMTWNGKTGTKIRKNNFLLTENGLIQVEGVRLHNMHDAFLANGPNAGFEIRDSWISWNRDDLFEGYLHNLGIHNSLIDGTYTFISSPDGECGQAKSAADRTVVIENSLIRLQRMPGPFSRESERWHWRVEGGHNLLWKLDGCSWNEWPEFVLRNNVFLIEGLRTTSEQLHSEECNLALPGDCQDSSLGKLKECENNLFLYSNYGNWLDAQMRPGPAPVSGNRFHNVNNPEYLPNGTDCYQRLTDDSRDSGYADVDAIWKKFRKQWIEKQVNPETSSNSPGQIPGVDFPVFDDGSVITLYNVKSENCLTSADSIEVMLRPCDSSPEQQFEVRSFSDGKLMASVLLIDSAGRYMHSSISDSENGHSRLAFPVTMEQPESGRPNFQERWYILPLDEISDTGQRLYSIETDGIQRSFLRDDSGDPAMQGLYFAGTETPLPQPRFARGKDPALHWLIVETTK
ncbi:MAG: hypothetical protein V3U76_03555 [Granulosicoccus sp.]